MFSLSLFCSYVRQFTLQRFPVTDAAAQELWPKRDVDLGGGSVRQQPLPRTCGRERGPTMAQTRSSCSKSATFASHISSICTTSLRPERLIALGRVDIVLAPVDVGYTLDTAGMIETLRRIGPRLVIPMHFFSQVRLDAFLETANAHYEVARANAPTIVVSRESLPTRPTILVLPTR